MTSSILHSCAELAARIPDLLAMFGRKAVEVDRVVALGGDGSCRRFWRLIFTDGATAIVIAPEPGSVQGNREAAAVAAIGRHLYHYRVPVPEILAYDSDTGALVCEDLGDVQLHSLAVATDWQDRDSVQRLRSCYQQALTILGDMQIQAAKGFNRAWCWDTPFYDKELMLSRESGYFLRAFWQGMLGQEVPTGLLGEFDRLATVAAEAPGSYFLHRDFQSRNLMVANDRVRVIDFQGGRMGPLGYDLAALLLDPYAALPPWFQEELYAYYLAQVETQTSIDKGKFNRWYRALALQRNLQILGAFAFLYLQRNKSFFGDYILPAVRSLIRLSAGEGPTALEVLHRTARQAETLLGND